MPLSVSEPSPAPAPAPAGPGAPLPLAGTGGPLAGRRERMLLAAVAAARTAGQPLELLAEPDGAFYALLAFPTPLDGLSAMRRLVGEHGVATLPGESFGLPSVAGRVVLRLSYGMLGSTALAEALGRLFAGCTALARG